VPGTAPLIALTGTSLNPGICSCLASTGGDADGLWGFPTSWQETWRSLSFGADSVYALDVHMSTSQRPLPWACSLDHCCRRTWERKAGACQRPRSMALDDGACRGLSLKFACCPQCSPLLVANSSVLGVLSLRIFDRCRGMSLSLTGHPDWAA
jgi:hypothetical protein